MCKKAEKSEKSEKSEKAEKAEKARNMRQNLAKTGFLSLQPNTDKGFIPRIMLVEIYDRYCKSHYLALSGLKFNFSFLLTTMVSTLLMTFTQFFAIPINSFRHLT